MEKKSFKKKLTLSISGSTKKKHDRIDYAKSQNKNTVIKNMIERNIIFI